VDEDRDHQAWIKKLVQALKDGTPLDLAPLEDVDVSLARDWPAPRRLPGEALRAALLSSDLRPDPRGLKIRAAYITGITDHFATSRWPWIMRAFCLVRRPAGLGQPPNSIGGQPQLVEHCAEWLASVDAIEELLAHIGRQSLLCLAPEAGPRGVVLRFTASVALAAFQPTGQGAVGHPRTGGVTLHTAAAWRTEVICRLTARTLAAHRSPLRHLMPRS